MRTIQLVATGMGWDEHDVGKETWTLLKAFIKGARADKIFSMDGLNITLINSGKMTEREVLDRIGKIPFITNENFPVDKMKDEFHTDYATNSVCYMIAMAMMEGYEKIELFGVNQAGMFEYMEQRRGVEFWLGIAMGKGIEIYINPPTALLKDKGGPYGYEETKAFKNERKAKGGIKKVIDLVGYVQGYKPE